MPGPGPLELRLKCRGGKAEKQVGSTPFVSQTGSSEGGGHTALWSQPVCFDGYNLVGLLVVQ